MEQIKRMLVNQRGFIVQALKQWTESNTSNVEVRQKFAQQIKEQKDAIDQLTNEANETCTKCKHQDSADDEASMERDRTIGKGSMVNFGFNDSSSEEWPQNRYGARNLYMSICFSLKSRLSEQFHRSEMSQIKA